MNNKVRVMCWILLIGLLYGCASTGPYDSTIAHNEEAAMINIELGLRYLEQGNIERGKAKLLKAMQQASNRSEPYLAMAHYSQQTGEFDEANAFYRKAISKEPSSGEAHNNYGVFLCQQQRYSDAEKEFLLAVKDKNYGAIGKSYENLGLCALKTGDTVKQAKYFKLALDHNPYLSVSLFQMSLLDFNAGQYQQANRYYQQYRKLTEPSAPSLWLGIQIAAAIGDSNARDSYGLLLKNLFADSPEYVRWMELSQS